MDEAIAGLRKAVFEHQMALEYRDTAAKNLAPSDEQMRLATVQHVVRARQLQFAVEDLIRAYERRARGGL